MQLESVTQSLGLRPKTNINKRVEISGAYASDLLSDVLANAKSGALWVTNHKHVNIIGVASMLDLAGVIIAGGIDPDSTTIEKAIEESVPLYITDMMLYELAGRMWKFGIQSC